MPSSPNARRPAARGPFAACSGLLGLVMLVALLLAPRGAVGAPPDSDSESGTETQTETADEASPGDNDSDSDSPDEGGESSPSSASELIPPEGLPPEGPLPPGAEEQADQDRDEDEGQGQAGDGPGPEDDADGPGTGQGTGEPSQTPQNKEDEADEDAALAVGGCEIRNRGDPLYPVVQALGALRAGRLEVLDCRQVTEARSNRLLEARIQGADQELLLYRLETLAADGFEVYLAPVGTHEVLLGARPAVSSGAVLYVNVDTISLRGSFVEGDDRERVEMVLGLQSGNFYPFEYSARLAELGYRAEFLPVGEGEVLIEVRPGRSIRRVRVRGHTPLAKRDVLRQLTFQAQPGSLARGECIEPKVLRQGDPPPICDARDIACLEWERDEVAHMDEFLFDNGYLRGHASLALVCGRESDEADLYVLLDKGKPYKIDRREVSVVGTDGSLDATSEEPLDERDERWIRRQFIPKVLGVFRTRVTREFMDKAVENVERAYAEPNSGLGGFWRGSGVTPHPEVDVASSYDQLDRESPILDSHNLPLEVSVYRGPAVQTEFKPSFDRRPRRRRESGLSFSDTQLRAQIQLFNRREPATPAAARRESANLRAYYQSKGYLFARVQGLHLDFKSIDKLRFEVDEGPKVRIANLELVRPARLIPAVAKRIEGRWNEERALRKGGTFSESEALSDIQAVTAAYNAEGYLCAQVVLEIAFWRQGLDGDEPGTKAVLDAQTLLDSGGDPAWLEQFDADGLAGVLSAERAKVWVRVRVEPGPRVLTAASEEVRYLDQRIPASRKVDDLIIRDPSTQEVAWGAPRMLRDSPLRHRDQDEPGGVPVTLSLEREARNFVVDRYRDSGFPIADAELTWRYTNARGESLLLKSARNLPDSRYGICTARAQDPAVALEPVVNVYEGRRGEFGDTLFRGNFKTKTWVLRRELEFETGQSYSQQLVDASAASIEATGVARSVTITPYPVGCYWDEPGPCQVHQVVAFEEAKDVAMTIDFGFGAATLNPFYVFANPAFPNLFGTGWDLSLEGRWGFDLSTVLEGSDLCAGQDCYERLAAATLSRPHIFASAVDLDINGRVQSRATPARGEILSVVGSLRLSRRFREWTFYVGYLFQLANVSKDIVKPLVGAEDDWVNRGGGVVADLTGLIDTGVLLTRVDNPFNPYDGFLATMDIKLASPWLGGNDWWARIDLSWQHFIPIPRTQDRLNFRYSLRYGQLVPFHGPGFGGEEVGTDTVPDVWRYYGGGTADLGLRGILPETMLVDVEQVELPYGGVVYRPRAQGGHVRAIGTVALQVTSIKDIFGGALAHSLFYDFGVLTQFWSKANLRRDFRHSVGVNFLKLDINIVTMALGYAVLIPGRYNVGATDDVNGRLVFDVGVTF
ncbi:BamA/TamA family outer membrane protein [Pseudenhygromyxa sp. WMMC2535]|uniref:BamA/TamA family outer membrane protein n=1 Tax=Pseudenhygromyxa sp. WMMC2535 TaxID=2712867 RepID=UPI001595FE98|nr:BamA/TamA family outer membrane protein [Pseudenhygromyxa sp. WMMC2535]NVB41670.1 BamA/TamA family outer membrane protein [Pseudenhygromyxa sp. WMMC2535]